MTMQTGMPAEIITQLTRGERAITQEVASIFECVFGPIVHRLVTLQNFYDLEMYVWQIELDFVKGKSLQRSGEERWAVSNDEAAALADLKDIIRTTVREKRARIMREIRAKRRLR